MLRILLGEGKAFALEPLAFTLAEALCASAGEQAEPFSLAKAKPSHLNLWFALAEALCASAGDQLLSVLQGTGEQTTPARPAAAGQRLGFANDGLS